MRKEILFKVRYAKPEHAEGIANLYKAWLDFKGILPDKLIEPDSKKDISSYLNNPSLKKKYIVAESKDGEVIGACYIDTSDLLFQTIRIGDVMVDPKFRRKKVGSALIDKIIEFAKNNNVIKIWLWTQEELKPAINFYKSKGFFLEGKQKDQFCGKDAILYGLIIKK